MIISVFFTWFWLLYYRWHGAGCVRPRHRHDSFGYQYRLLLQRLHRIQNLNQAKSVLVKRMFRNKKQIIKLIFFPKINFYFKLNSVVWYYFWCVFVRQISHDVKALINFTLLFIRLMTSLVNKSADWPPNYHKIWIFPHLLLNY